MTALATGWTPDVLGDMPDAFRRACHWALYAQSLSGADGLPSTEIPAGGSLEAKRNAAKLSIEVAKVRTALFPEDER